MRRLPLLTLLLASAGCGQTGELFLPRTDAAGTPATAEEASTAGGENAAPTQATEPTRDEKDDDEETPAG